MEGCRKFARGDHNDQIGQGGGFFTLADRIIYEGTFQQAYFLMNSRKSPQGNPPGHTGFRD